MLVCDFAFASCPITIAAPEMSQSRESFIQTISDRSGCTTIALGIVLKSSRTSVSPASQLVIPAFRCPSNEQSMIKNGQLGAVFPVIIP